MARNIQRIIVIKLCCLGDILFMTPALRALKETFPKAQIDFLASSWVYDLVKRLPYINQFIPWDIPYKKISLPKKISSVFSIVKIFKNNRYDLAFIGHRHPFFALIAAMGQVKYRAGFASKYRVLNSFLTHSAPFRQDIHETQRYLDIARLLGAESRHENMQIATKIEDADIFRQLSAIYGIDSNRPLIGILPGGGKNPGTSMQIKQWGKEKFAGLCRNLIKQSDCQILLLGGESDREVSSWIYKELFSGNAIFDIAGKTSLDELAAVLAHCQLVICGDSGPVYLAAALNTPTLTLYGPSDPRLVAPRGARNRHLWKQVSCSPCYTPETIYNKSRYQGNEFICWTKTHACMKELTVEEVEKIAQEMLHGKA